MPKRFTEGTYNERVLRIRGMNNAFQTLTKQKVNVALTKSYNDLTKLLDLTSLEPLERTVYESKRKGITKLANELGINLSNTIKSGITGFSKEAAKTQKDATQRYLNSEDYKADLEYYFLIPKEVLFNVVNRTWSDGFKFSDRIWRNTQHTKNGINSILTAGIARGQSAVDMSMELKRFLVDSTIKPGKTWKVGVKNSVTSNGTVHYNALRLAITEINNSYREAQVINNKRSPVTNGLRWHLSGSHPRPDICDVWAEQDLYGFGPGGYPPEAVPIDHPRGFCFFTDIIRPASEWSKPKPPTPPRKPFGKDQVEKILRDKKLKPGEINSGVKTYNAGKKVLADEETRIDRKTSKRAIKK